MKVRIEYTKDVFEAPEDLMRVFRTAFPGYKGRKFRLVIRPYVCMNDTYWDGGSKSDYVLVRLADYSVLQLPDVISGGFAPNAMQNSKALSHVEIPNGIAVVRHSIFCGKDTGLTITLRSDNTPRSLTSARVQP